MESIPNRHLLAAVVVFLSGPFGPTASAQDAVCIGNIGETVISGNLNVAAGCRLEGTLVIGKVTLFAGGSLTAREAQILGDVEGKRGDFVDIDDSFIGGHLRLEEFVGDLSTLQRTAIVGNAELRNNRSRLEILNNDIGGNLQVSGNSGGALISGNAVARDLRCEKNDPAPVGLGNQVEGNAREQCADLQPEPTSATPPPPPPPASPPPPAPAPPPASTPPPASPPTSPPPASPPAPPPTPSPPPPAASEPPASVPPSAPPPSPTPTGPEIIDGGGGALGWPVLFLLLLLAARRRRMRC